MLFAAHLRLPETVPALLKDERAHTVLRQLGLEHVAHTRVGSAEHRGISGGEMRRVSIGIELVAAPDVLVLDEPTSGLDSVSAARLVKLLKDLAEGESKTTIVASIHQPSSALYHAFSQVVLLANGKQLYFGPGGIHPAEFFASQGRPCPSGYNIADHLLEIASAPLDGLMCGPAAVVGPAIIESSRGTSGTNSQDEGHEDSSWEKHQANANGTPTDKGLVSQQMLITDNTIPRTNTDVSGLGDARGQQESKRWPSTHCATTFLTQIEVLSGREWKNLKR